MGVLYASPLAAPPAAEAHVSHAPFGAWIVHARLSLYGGRSVGRSVGLPAQHAAVETSTNCVKNDVRTLGRS